MTTPVMPRLSWSHVLVVVCVSGCTTTPASIDAVAEGYVRAALQLAQHDPALVEDWRGAESWRPGPRTPVADVQATITGLRQSLDRVEPDASHETARHRYLSSQLRALEFAAHRLMGETAGIDAQAGNEFGVVFSVLEPARMADLRASVAQALPGGGTLPERVAALKQRTAVPDGRRMAVMDAALAACRRVTTATVTLPANEQASITFERALGWDGYARYVGAHRTEIAVNADVPLDIARALRLACHEGYPGHHLQHVLIDQLRAERGWPELQLSPGFGPHLLYTEGAAEAGADLAFAPEERTRLYREQLLPAAGLPAGDAETLARVDALVSELVPVVTEVARLYLSDGISKERAIDRLREEALVLNPEGTLALIERRRARALVYGEGRRLVYGMMPGRSLAELHALFARSIALQ